MQKREGYRMESWNYRNNIENGKYFAKCKYAKYTLKLHYFIFKIFMKDKWLLKANLLIIF
jgi:hypothetical protein